MIDRSEWEWFGNVGHFILGYRCRFHLCTKVGPRLVSTVGELTPHGERCSSEECGCCGIPTIDGSELDSEGYNRAGEATVGHMRMCERWSGE